MILRIEAPLSEPPSTPAVFRDTTLYADLLCELDVLVECMRGTRSMYWKWLKHYGAHDYVAQLILKGEERHGLSLGFNRCSINVDRLTPETLNFVTGRLELFTRSNPWK
tara:strand:- start:107 stop:433 length:327 start_codon:yes stop_codon:yes gene_type:complete